MKDRKTHKATSMQIIKVGKLLEEHFDKMKMQYEQDWDDLRVAATAGVAFKTVANLRLQMFGKLASTTSSTRTKYRLEQIEACYVRLQARVHRLEEALGVTNNDNVNG